MGSVQDGVALMLERAEEGRGRWFLGRAESSAWSQDWRPGQRHRGSKKRTDGHCKAALVACDKRTRITY